MVAGLLLIFTAIALMIVFSTDGTYIMSSFFMQILLAFLTVMSMLLMLSVGGAQVNEEFEKHV